MSCRHFWLEHMVHPEAHGHAAIMLADLDSRRSDGHGQLESLMPHFALDRLLPLMSLFNNLFW